MIYKMERFIVHFLKLQAMFRYDITDWNPVMNSEQNWVSCLLQEFSQVTLGPTRSSFELLTTIANTLKTDEVEQRLGILAYLQPAADS